MKDEVLAATHAASAARAACTAAINAQNLIHEGSDPTECPTAWEFLDLAYWLCRTAQKVCEDAADNLDAEEADVRPALFAAHTRVMGAMEKACDAADELVCLAEQYGHEIRR